MPEYLSISGGAPTSYGVLVVEGVRQAFDRGPVLNDINLSVNAGEFLSLLGPSGCGKTSLLRIIAGLDSPTCGTVFLDGCDLSGVPANKRSIHTVFQSYALFPHLTVEENVAFGLRMKGIGLLSQREAVRRALEFGRISELAGRRPDQLSGGQRQRVALARALVNEPAVVLLDEPMAAIDQQLRKDLREELRAMQQRLGTTFICVTHDQEEAFAISDRVAVMNGGRIVQLAPPTDLYQKPATPFVARFLGECNLLPAKPAAAAGHGGIFETLLGDATVEGLVPPSPRLLLAVRPEEVEVLPPDRSEGAEAVLDSMQFSGPSRLLRFKVAGREELILASLPAGQSGELKAGCARRLRVRRGCGHLIADDEAD